VTQGRGRQWRLAGDSRFLAAQRIAPIAARALQSLDTNPLPDLDIDGIELLSRDHSSPQE
jgi:hypothetical protein